MDERLEKKLVENYPIIFKDYRGDMKKTCMAWGMACGDGWFKLIDEMCQDIISLIGDKDIQVIAHQVKEKFGSLRFYYGIEYDVSRNETINDKIRNWMFNKKLGRAYWKITNFRKKFYKNTMEKIEDIISEAENQSYETCETCGKPGKHLSENYWVYTSCEVCNEKFKEGKKQWTHPEDFDSVYELMFGKE